MTYTLAQIVYDGKSDQINICHVKVFGEIAHFLIATTSKDVAGDIHYGDQVRLWNMKYLLYNDDAKMRLTLTLIMLVHPLKKYLVIITVQQSHMF